MGARLGQPSTPSLATVVGLIQFLAVGTGVTHLVGVLARPDRRPVGAGLLGLERAMHLGTVAAALGGRAEGQRQQVEVRSGRGGAWQCVAAKWAGFRWMNVARR